LIIGLENSSIKDVVVDCMCPQKLVSSGGHIFLFTPFQQKQNFGFHNERVSYPVDAKVVQRIANQSVYPFHREIKTHAQLGD
jgi:hypothetical protein